MKFLKQMLRLLKRAAAKTLGSITDEWYWWFRHILGNKKWAKTSLTRESLESIGMKNFAGHIATYAPFQNVLEIGCASGSNLIVLARQFPNTRFYGIDVSAHAIQYGQKYIEAHYIRNISLSTGKAEDLGNFSDKSMDIVFTSAVLLYVDPHKIRVVLKEILRVAKKVIVLMEWNTNEEHSIYDDHWAHNWKNFFGELGEMNVRLTKLNPDPWDGHGYLVKVIPN